jgi:hypothetical protein
MANLISKLLDLLPDGRTFVGMRPRRTVFDNNVLVNYEETFRLVGKYAQTEFCENYITDKDPGIANRGAEHAEDDEVPRFLCVHLLLDR